MSKARIVKGDKVTARHHPVKPYGRRGRLDQADLLFTPGMVGTVACIACKVCIVDDPAQPGLYDSCPDMLVVDYHCPVTGTTQRTSLNFCNAKRVD